MMSDSQRIGLYYPYLHFPDNWLKIAALYWPRMGRIAPGRLHLNDSDTVRALSDELDFVVNVAPGPAATQLTSALMKVVEDHYDEFRALYSLPENPVIMSDACGPTWPNPQQIATDWRVRNPGELRAAAEVVALHKAKFDRSLFQTLSDAGLAFESGNWYGLHPELAWLYICALADELARINLLTPTTDQIVAHVESLSWTSDLFIDTLRERRPPNANVIPQPASRERVALLAL